MTKKHRGIPAVLVLLLFAIVFFSSCASSGEIDNGFYRRNSEDCLFCGRSFTADTQTDYLSKPGGRKLGSVGAGETLFVDYYFTDKNGDVFGLVNREFVGWVAMDDLTLVYDVTAFMSGNEDSISEIGENELPDTPRILWSYPCSGEVTGLDSSMDEEINLTHQYSDSEGRRWVYLASYSVASGWICYDDPYNEAIEKVDYGEAKMTFELPSERPGFWDGVPPYVPYILGGIALIVLVEVIIQVCAYMKKKKNKRT